MNQALAEVIIPEETWPEQGRWTYQDYLNLPDDGCRYEIIKGVLYVTNAPNIDHQFAVMEIAFQIKSFVNAKKLGYVLTAPFEVHLSEESRPVQPDVFFICTENWPGPGAAHFEGGPDLVVEVLSPSTRRSDQVIKFTAYEKAGVSEYWIADPVTKSVQLYVLDKNQQYELKGAFIGEEPINSQVLEGLNILPNSLFNTFE